MIKKHHEHPTREARHELPGGKQGEDKHEQGKEEPGQALVRYLPDGGATLLLIYVENLSSEAISQVWLSSSIGSTHCALQAGAWKGSA